MIELDLRNTHPQGLSNGSDPPILPPGFVAAGVAADVHPPKSSSAVTVGCTAAGLLAEDIGAPQPPEISFGVIFDGTLPSSTLGAAGFAGSGAPHAFVSAPPHGSNILEAGGDAGPARDDCTVGIGAGLGAVVVGDERLNAELKFVGLRNVGEDKGAFAAGPDGADAKSLKPSSPNRLAGIEVVVGLGIGGDGVFCVKEKFKAFDMDADGACAGLGAGGLLAVPAKKLPPLNGGGEDIWAATAGDLAGMFVGNPKPAKEDDDGGGGDVVVGKSNNEPDD